jgi:hypothetical protein
MFYKFFSRKSFLLSDNVKNLSGVREAKNYATIWRIRVACRIARQQARTCMHTPTRSGIHTHMLTHAHAHAREHSPIFNTYCFSTATMIHEQASRLRYTYIACLVDIHVKLIFLDSLLHRLDDVSPDVQVRLYRVEIAQIIKCFEGGFSGRQTRSKHC